MALRAVLFDAGNTLVHLDYPALVRAGAGLGLPSDAGQLRAAECRGREWLDRELLRRWEERPPARTGWVTRADWQGFWHQIAGGLVAQTEQQESLGNFLNQAAGGGGYWRAVPPDAAATLEALRRRGLALGVVSNSDGTCRQLLTRMGLAHYFDVIVDSAVVGVEKPHADIFAHALEQLGVRPAEALMVGDFYSLDVVGAQRAGLHALLYDPIDGSWATSAPRVRSLTEVLPHLLALG